MISKCFLDIWLVFRIILYVRVTIVSGAIGVGKKLCVYVCPFVLPSFGNLT